MILQEVKTMRKKYMYHAILSDGTKIIAYEDGSAEDRDGHEYRIVSHIEPDLFDMNDEIVVVDGWIQVL